MPEPKCHDCQVVMTPENSRIRPELFYCDRCLPGQFLPPEGRPTDLLDPPSDPSAKTLRDEFAMAALMGMNASPELLQVITSGEIKDGSYLEKMAKHAYGQADAMMKRRLK